MRLAHFKVYIGLKIKVFTMESALFFLRNSAH